MELKELIYFARVLEAGSFGKAVATINRTQPAISLAIARLEADLDVKLLERNSRGVEPTAFGEIVYQSTRDIEQTLKAMKNSVDYMRDPNNGHLVICKGQTVSTRFVLDCINGILAKFPNFRIQVLVGTYEEYYSKLISSDIDLIISQLPPSDDDPCVVSEPLFTDSFSMTCRVEHPLRDKQNIEVSDLLDFPWISGGPLDAVLPGWSEFFRARGLPPPRPSIDTFGPTVVKSALQLGDYLAILPLQFIADEILAGQLAVLSLPELKWQQVKGITSKRREFIPASLELLMNTMRELSMENSYTA